jgi:predicted metal-dependent hydrolase
MPAELLVIEGLPAAVVVERKKTSACRLKVFPAEGVPFANRPGQVKFSVPPETSSEWIVRYLQSKKDWILQKLEAFNKTGPYGAGGEIRSGISVRMLGEDMLFSLHRAGKPQVYAEYRTIHIAAPVHSPPLLTGLFEDWWRKQARALYGEILDSLYPVIGKHGVTKPLLRIRKMRTLWGSSSPRRHSITWKHRKEILDNDVARGL